MPSPEIEEFARLLVEQVRDPAIRGCDMNLRADTTYASAKRWKSLASTEFGDSPKDVVIPDAVDATIARLLIAIDGGMRLLYVASDGKVVDLSDDGMGELSGWYSVWRDKYSTQRRFD
jgi:hypothetical protein